MAGRLRWGDADDDDDVLPVSTSVGPNDKGIITKVDYVRNPKGDAVKRTTKIQIVKTETRVYDVTAERRSWAKFGHAKTDNLGVTVRSIDEIPFERTNKAKKSEDPKKANFKSTLNAGDKSQVTQSLAEILAEKRRNREMMRAKGLLSGAEAPPGEDDPMPKKEGMYVPPSRKAGANGMPNRPDFENSLRVTNLSENVTDQDLKDLFGPFGAITRVYVAYDRETGEHRGFAFVNFRDKRAAEHAMSVLDGYGFDNLILRVELAAPREDKN